MTVPSTNAGFLELLGFFGPKVGFSLLCGALLGLERELKHKAAGMKTNMLICMGACLFTAMSVFLSEAHAEVGRYGDPARLAAQVVSGIGFIGGGAILKERGTIFGVTTAAMIWLVAAIGVCVGMGLVNIAVFLSISTVIALVAVTQFEDRVLGRAGHFGCEIVVEDVSGETRQAINLALDVQGLSIEDFHLEPRGELTLLRLRYEGPIRAHKLFLLELWKTVGVREVRQI